MLRNVCNFKIISVTRKFILTINFLVYVMETKTFPVQETESGIFYGLRYGIQNFLVWRTEPKIFSGFQNINWKNSGFHFNQKLSRIYGTIFHFQSLLLILKKTYIYEIITLDAFMYIVVVLYRIKWRRISIEIFDFNEAVKQFKHGNR